VFTHLILSHGLKPLIIHRNLQTENVLIFIDRAKMDQIIGRMTKNLKK
jgi:hypothetical protein